MSKQFSLGDITVIITLAGRGESTSLSLHCLSRAVFLAPLMRLTEYSATVDRDLCGS